MLSTLVSRRTARLTLAAAAVALVAACNDSTGPDGDHDEEVEAIRLTIVQGATQYGPYTFSGASVTPSPFRVPVGTSTVTAEFLGDDGDVVAVDGAEHTFDLRDVTPATALTFTRTGPFAGTLTAPAATSATVRVCMTHGDHCDVDVSVPVTIGG